MKQTNVDASTMRQMNRANVLEVIRAQEPISRVDIAQATGLNKATVSSLVDELIQEQYVCEIGYGTSSGGRKPILLKFNAKSAYTVGVDVQISHLTTVLCDANGAIIYENVLDIPSETPGMDVHVLLGRIQSEVRRAVERAPESPHGVLGVGVALPGMVSFQTGYVYYIPNLGISQWDLRGALAELLNMPVYVDNDANCGAWAEFSRESSGAQNLVYINAGIGVGAGLILGGKLYRGHNGLAGEYGHMSISAMGLHCACGSYGCWETYASQSALHRYVTETGEHAPGSPLDPDFVKHVVEKANHRQPNYVGALTTVGHYLGVGIANISSTLNPEVIYIGGPLAHAGQFILPEIKRMLQIRSISITKKTPVTLGHTNSVAVGAAGIAAEETLFTKALAPHGTESV